MTTMTRTNVLAASAALLGVLGLAACTAEQPTVTETPTATASAPSSATSSSPAASTAPEETPYTAPTVGAQVPADEVADARQAGASVFVAPNGDGSGVAVTPGYDLTAPVEAAIESVDGNIPSGGVASSDFDVASNVSALHNSLENAGLGAVVIIQGMTLDGTTVKPNGYAVVTLGIADGAVPKAGHVFTSKGDALAFAKSAAAKVGAQVIDLTN